ncbi:hypothetical protein V8C86DRAFT_2510782 [Haematococcus lacustris]
MSMSSSLLSAAPAPAFCLVFITAQRCCSNCTTVALHTAGTSHPLAWSFPSGTRPAPVPPPRTAPPAGLCGGSPAAPLPVSPPPPPACPRLYRGPWRARQTVAHAATTRPSVVRCGSRGSPVRHSLSSRVGSAGQRASREEEGGTPRRASACTSTARDHSRATRAGGCRAGGCCR